MDEAKYQGNVLARCSNQWHHLLVEAAALKATLLKAACVGEELDAMKKALFYGRSEDGVHHHSNGREIAGFDFKRRQLLHALLGVLSEGAELVQALYPYLFEGKELDEVNAQEEFGDLNWYRVRGLNLLSQNESQNRAQNDAKLEARFGAVFTSEAANNRDLDEERRTLEG